MVRNVDLKNFLKLFDILQQEIMLFVSSGKIAALAFASNDQNMQFEDFRFRSSFGLKQTVGLALVDSSLTEEGSRLQIYEDECEGRHLYATVAPLPFYDPEGKRLRM